MMAVMESHARPRPDHVDLCIIGSGSGLSLIDDDIDDWQIALLDNGVGPTQIFGGTCLNAGCIPSKMLAKPAGFSLAPEQARLINADVKFLGVDHKAAPLKGQFTERLALDLHLARRELTLHSTHEVAFMTTALSMVSAGQGITACLPYAASLVELHQLEMRPV